MRFLWKIQHFIFSHGIGTAGLKIASQMYAQTHPIDYFLIRVKAYNKASQRMVEKLGAQRLEDEVDIMLDVVKKLTQEIGGEQGDNLLAKFLDGYDVENQNVFRYRYDV